MDAVVEALGSSPLLLLVGGFVLLAAIVLGRRIDLRIGSMHAQLQPNGGSSLRDAVDRIEAKADDALDRIGSLEATAAQVAVVVNQPAPLPAPRSAGGRSTD